MTQSTMVHPDTIEHSLVDSRNYCRKLTRSAARNFYYGLRLLPEPKRSAMFALYAFNRLIDDIADREDGRTPARRREELEHWREQTHAVLAGHPDATLGDSAHPVWPAFTDLVTRYRVPSSLFNAAVAGQQQDLEPAPFHNFGQLHEYCYRVAGVVGLASIHVWGYRGGESTEGMAVALGVAFQITNILRDLREDAARGRIYLPLEDLERFGVTPAQLHRGEGGPAFERLMRFEIDRAEDHYRLAGGLELLIEPDSRPTLIAMTEIYHRLLGKISTAPGDVLRKRVSLSTWSKLRIGWRAARSSRGHHASVAGGR